MSEDDPNPRASSYVPRGPNRDLRAAMREQLRGVGIELDDPAPARPKTPGGPSDAPPLDRELVREILTAAGASEAELAWLVPSCPSLEHARAWRRPGHVEPLPVAAAEPSHVDEQPEPAPPQRGWPKINR